MFDSEQNFNDAYSETERINHIVNNLAGNGRIMTGVFIKDGDFRRNDSKNPFENRNTSSTFNNASEQVLKKKPSKFKTIKTVFKIGSAIGIVYVGYKYIYKPLKKEYDNYLDRIVVHCESEKPLDGRIRVFTPLEQKAYEHKYGKSETYLDPSQYTIHDDNIV